MGPGRSAGIALETHPDQYRHWRLSIEPPLATLTMAVAEDAPLVPGYKLKLNSYDLGVDIELADAVARLRFEHPEVRAVIITGGLDRVFCAGANIHMLASSTHAFKVNFCKYTNETRLAMEDASAHSGQHYLAACNGATAGGGYELALACEEIYLVDDGNSTVSLPEVPLLGVLPGTGGLTRVVDKRKVRRDLADVFSTLAEGIKGKRAVEWRLVDGVFPRGRFSQAVRERALALASGEPPLQGPGIVLDALAPEATADSVRYRHVELKLDHENRTAELIVDGPQGAQPDTREAILHAGADFWPLRAFREIDDALLRLRFHHDNIGLVTLKTRGDLTAMRHIDTTLYRLREDWLVNEILLLMARTLRRLDLTARSLFAVIDEGSCFAGSLLEIALAADRIYILRDADGQVRVAGSPLNGGLLPMTHGLSRLQVRFIAEPERAGDIAGASEPFDTDAAEAAGLATAAVDAIDWEDELRVAIEERVSLSPDALTGMEANLRFAGAENRDSKIFSRLSAWQNWIFSRPNATGDRGALTLYGKPERPQFDLAEDLMSLYERIPNNVDLSNDKRLLRALENWLPDYLQWWGDMGPEGFQADDVYLRTAVSVEPGGWAHFDYVKMPDYRWGIFLAPPELDRRVGFGDHLGKPAWQEVPGEYRNMLRRLIVTQGDTEPASVEQQRLLGQSAPCLYDLRNLFQVNVEEGRHLWAMVYLLHSYFGRDGREESEELLERRSGSSDKPRILEAFNEPIADWLSFYMFTTFTDRDGKYQLLALAESGFDPLSRTTRFMLTEEAHHMFVGESGVRRVVRRTCELMRETGDDDVRRQGAVDLPTIQKYINLWFSLSLDLFGGEVSSNAASFFSAGMKGRAQEPKYSDHLALEGSYPVGGEQIPLRNAMNELLRDAYMEDCEKCITRWNRVIDEHEIPYRLRLPERRFHRHIGAYSSERFDPEGHRLSEAQWNERRDEFLPSEKDVAYVRNLMVPVMEVGKIAHWLGKPTSGIHGLPFEFEYVRREQ